MAKWEPVGSGSYTVYRKKKSNGWIWVVLFVLFVLWASSSKGAQTTGVPANEYSVESR